MAPGAGVVDPDAFGPALADAGYVVFPRFLDERATADLRDRARTLDAAGEFADARVGRGASRVRREDVRGDRIRWLADGATDPAERELRVSLDVVRAAANRSLQLGAFDVELHYAIYPPGAGYARHVDTFRDDDARVLSCVVYLNESWRESDGGELRIWRDDGTTLDVTPVGGTLVAFLAGRVPHEVRPASRARTSVTGWFRKRAPV